MIANLGENNWIDRRHSIEISILLQSIKIILTSKSNFVLLARVLLF
ncbi:MAG: hypothetical protein KJ588_05145 [Gammaproteobacteria bacterium]|nr:hypothetical protein [Gammaproteobacteria bacterium]